jgi:mono/diheme cytochrome c family protein
MRQLIGGLIVTLALSGAAVAQEAPTPPDSANGKALAGELCASCHLTAPEDRGPVPDGIPTFMAVADRPGIDEDALTAALLKEHPVMPQPPLTSRQTADVVAYILSLRR